MSGQLLLLLTGVPPRAASFPDAALPWTLKAKAGMNWLAAIAPTEVVFIN